MDIRIILITLLIMLVILIIHVWRLDKKRTLAVRVREKFLQAQSTLSGGPVVFSGGKVKVGSLDFFLKKPFKVLAEAVLWDDQQIKHKILCDYRIIENAELQAITT